MIRPDKIGVQYIVKYNGSEFNIIIENNPDNYALYKKLGLDVFKVVNKEPIKPLEKLEDKPKKKNASRKSK